MIVAILFNSFAGKHKEFHQYSRSLADILQGHTVITCSADLGEQYLAPAFANLHVIACHETSFRGRIHEAVSHIAAFQPDLLVCAGGDGFIAYVADWLIRNNQRIPLLGLAGGTVNAGPLIRFGLHNIKQLNPDQLNFDQVGAVEASADGRLLGYAFHDLIIADSFLSTMDGQTVNIAARDFLIDGSKRIVSPASNIVTDCFRIVKNGERVHHRSHDIAQIIVSPLHKKSFYRGKAITGALCLTDGSDDLAAVGLCDRIVVRSNAGDTGNQTVSIEHLLFKEGDKIEMSGFHDNGCLILDGNPFHSTRGTLTLRFLNNVVTCADAK